MLKKAIDSWKHSRAISEVRSLLIGKALIAHENEGQWNLVSDGEVYVYTMFWRLVGSNHILVTSEDHQQQFGLPQPIDAAAKFNDALAMARVTGVDVSPVTGDLLISFPNYRLEVITCSMGYETWSIGRQDSYETLFVGANGGIL
ncbi:MAG: hypothetical protein R3E14_04945 [Erythrobacter sp.]